VSDPATPLDAWRERAANGALSADDLHAVIGHMRRGNADRVRAAAIGIAAAYVQATADPQVVIELIQIAESKDAADDAVRTDAVRALAKATGYHGQRVQLDL
jgi:hypothetical protein